MILWFISRLPTYGWWQTSSKAQTFKFLSISFLLFIKDMQTQWTTWLYYEHATYSCISSRQFVCSYLWMHIAAMQHRSFVPCNQNWKCLVCHTYNQGRKQNWFFQNFRFLWTHDFTTTLFSTTGWGMICDGLLFDQPWIATYMLLIWNW